MVWPLESGKLNTNDNFQNKLERLEYFFEKILGYSMDDAVEEFIDGYEIFPDEDLKVIQKYFQKNIEDKKFFEGLIKIGKELKQYDHGIHL